MCCFFAASQTAFSLLTVWGVNLVVLHCGGCDGYGYHVYTHMLMQSRHIDCSPLFGQNWGTYYDSIYAYISVICVYWVLMMWYRCDIYPTMNYWYYKYVINHICQKTTQCVLLSCSGVFGNMCIKMVFCMHCDNSWHEMCFITLPTTGITAHYLIFGCSYPIIMCKCYYYRTMFQITIKSWVIAPPFQNKTTFFFFIQDKKLNVKQNTRSFREAWKRN